MSVSRRGAGWSATLENNTDRNLPDARLVLGQRLYRLGALPPHQGKTLNLGMDSGTALTSFLNQYSEPFNQAANSLSKISATTPWPSATSPKGRWRPPSWRRMNPAEGGFQSSFEVFRPLDLSRFADADHAILLAWDPDDSPAAPLNRFAARRTHRDTLFRLVAPVK